MSSEYPVLDNRPIDQWRVVELKEELRRRKLTTKGLKDDLVKRLLEAVLNEREAVNERLSNGFNSESDAQVECEGSEPKQIESQTIEHVIDPVVNKSEKIDKVDDNAPMIDISGNTSSIKPVEKDEAEGGKLMDGVETCNMKETAIQSISMESSMMDSQTVQIQLESSVQETESYETQVDDKASKHSSLEDVKSGVSNSSQTVQIQLESSAQETESYETQVDDKASKPSALEDVKSGVSNSSQSLQIQLEFCVQETKFNEIQVDDKDSKPPSLEDVKYGVSNSSQSLQIQLESCVQETKSNEIPVDDKDSKPPSLEDVKSAVSNSSQRSQIQFEPCAQETKSNELQVDHEDSKPPSLEDVKSNVFNSNNQVPEVSSVLGFQVKCESISTDSVSINEKNELKDNLNAHNLHLELDVVKPEMVEPLSGDVPTTDVGGDLHSLGDEKPGGDQGSVEKVDDTSAATVDLSKKKDNSDAGSPEKLNLDRSSGDDSMEEDVLDSKQIDSNHISDEAVDRSEPIKLDVVQEGHIEAKAVELSPGKKDVHSEKNHNIEVSSEKRKLEDQEPIRNNEPSKRQRRWFLETNIPEPQTTNLTPLSTPKDAFQSTPRRAFTRSESTVSVDSPKERVVPPSQKNPTTSLRIDRFLRPFTLKAVQELLAKTGTLSEFWMDHIKTHCYVMYSSVEEAIATRNALYNLQWPPNGGRLLIAEFVEPHEVKMRVEAPPQSPVPVSPSPTTPSAPAPSSQPQSTSRQHGLGQQLPPPPPLPPPPTLSDPPQARERLPLPPPPPKRPELPPKKPEPPIVTLDDLFKKTKATPRIYYLPLSEEQVATKLPGQGRNTNRD